MNASFESASELDDAEAGLRNDEANTWMLRGIALLQANTRESLAGSLDCFDRATVLRRGLPFGRNPWYLYGFIAGWLNRGDALTRLGSRENLEAALECYAAALRRLEGLPPEAHPLFRKRHAIAWTNRGITLQKRGKDGDAAAAAASFARGLEILRKARAEKDPDLSFLMSGMLVNRGNALLDLVPASAAEARESAEEALRLVAGREGENVLEAETGLKARHVLCRANAHLIEADGLSAPDALKMAAATTDLVEEGLHLARTWESRGCGQFRPLAAELFRFGALVYQAYQPQFLGEYLQENLAGGGNERERRAASMEALWREMRDIQRNIFNTVNTPEYSAFLERLRQVRLGEEKLRAMVGEGAKGKE